MTPVSSPFVPDVRYLVETPAHAAAIEAIAARAFGPGRFARAAERVREIAPLDPSLCFVAVRAGAVVGSVRQTPVLIGDRRAIMLGPLAVDVSCKGRGIGRHLMALAAAAARERGESVSFLVGDLGYYGPHGYVPLPQGTILLPRPADPSRILGLGLVQGALIGLAGEVRRRK